MTDKVSLNISDELSIVLCGPAGSGVQTVEQLLVKILKRTGCNVFATKEYMSRVRGGHNSITIRASSKPVQAPIDRIDILIPLSKGSVEHVENRLSSGTLILSEPDFLSDRIIASDVKCLEIPFTKIAKESGSKLYSNIVAIGVICGLMDLESDLVTGLIQDRFEDKDKSTIDENIVALTKGYETGSEYRQQGNVSIDIATDKSIDNQILLNGVQAVGLGAIAAGCNFIGAYPMSPSTGLLQFLAKHGNDYNILVEQAEDEIAAVNMALGAWYAGARGIASTSGGGFALMCEGLSLAGMIESPLVVHVAQRPGPATGLPTRTGQEDLNLCLYAGHGEFPRAIFAPGDLQEAFDLTVKAFDLADRLQVPVFILTDQYFVDTYYNTEKIDVSSVKVEKHIVETTKDYQRFALTENGLSPRGIPGLGDGLVTVDSDEHYESGHITEEMPTRISMVDKRLKKGKLLEDTVFQPTLWPNSDYKTLVLCWGSTKTVVRQALEIIGRDDISMLHFPQVFPLPACLPDMLNKAQKVICLEGNATAQFASLVKANTGIDIDETILKYDGLQFTIEQVVESINSIITRENA